MSKKHEEGNDVRILSRSGRIRVEEGTKRLRMAKDALVGIRTWGRIDFLTNHRGWTLVRGEHPPDELS